MKIVNRPSNLYRRERCPGSGHQEATVAEIEQKDTKYSAGGTKLHNIVPVVLAGGWPPDVHELSADEIRSVDYCVEKTREVASRYSTDAVVITEYKLDLSEFDLQGGTIDYGIVDGTRAAIMDYKFGYRYTDHPRFNTQILSYAIGLWIRFGVTEIELSICQPIKESEEQKYRTINITLEDIEAAVKRIALITEGTKPEDAPLIPGEKQCEFCSAFQSCKAIQEKVTEIVPQGNTIDTYFRGLNEDDAQAFYDKVQLAKKWFSKAQDDIEEIIKSGQRFITGYEIGPGRKSKKWKSESAAKTELTILSHEKGISSVDLVVEKFITPAAALKLFGKDPRVDALYDTVEGSPTVKKVFVTKKKLEAPSAEG